MSTFLDAGRGVADDVVEVLFQLFQHALDTFGGEGVLVAGLGGRQDEQVLRALVLDQRLIHVGIAVDQVDEVVNHAAFAAHDQVEVTQADVKVDDDGFETAQGQPGTDGGAGGCFAHPALA